MPSWALRASSRRRRAAFLPSFIPLGALHLWLPQPDQSSRRLEREAGLNVEVMWLSGRLAPDHETVADLRKGHRHLPDCPIPCVKASREDVFDQIDQRPAAA